MQLKTWTKQDISMGTRVFLRIDGNIPVRDGVAHDGDNGRIAQAIPEITKLRAHGARVIIATHLGDPEGKADPAFSTVPVARLLEKKLGKSIQMIPSVTGADAERVIMGLQPGDVAFLENVRFDPGEEENDEFFSRALARLADVYVDNAFGVCHRAHASVVGITKYLPSFAGELICREVDELSKMPEHPFVLIMGGAKISSKAPIIERIGKGADKVLLGGAIALPFLEAAGRPMEVASKLIKPDDVALARTLLKEFGDKIVLPEDLVVDNDGTIAFDIGPKTIALFNSHLKDAQTVIWNGPLGIIEKPEGRESTLAIAKQLNDHKVSRSIIGGGESVEFLEEKDLLGGFTHVSTGGGAMLAFLSGEKLPGLEVLEAKV